MRRKDITPRILAMILAAASIFRAVPAVVYADETSLVQEIQTEAETQPEVVETETETQPEAPQTETETQPEVVETETETQPEAPQTETEIQPET